MQYYVVIGIRLSELKCIYVITPYYNKKMSEEHRILRIPCGKSPVYLTTELVRNGITICSTQYVTYITVVTQCKTIIITRTALHKLHSYRGRIMYTYVVQQYTFPVSACTCG